MTPYEQQRIFAVAMQQAKAERDARIAEQVRAIDRVLALVKAA